MSESPLILVTGGTGKVGSRLVDHLRNSNFAIRIASRRPPQDNAQNEAEYRHFDWTDETTYAPVLTGVQRLFLISPIRVADPTAPMMTFLKYAQQAGVRRIVLLSSSLFNAETPGLGAIHKEIQEHAREWAVLRPSWFMQNFIGSHYHAASIRNEGIIYTAAGDGKISFIDADDIAAVGAHALTDEPPHNTDYILTGPQALSYAEAAAILSNAFERPIRAVSVSPAELQEKIVHYGVPAPFAALLAQTDNTIIRNGLEDRVTSAVERITGHAPRSLATFAQDYMKSVK